jgi:DAHP synthetase I family
MTNIECESDKIVNQRNQVADILTAQDSGDMLWIQGPCALTNQTQTLLDEAISMREVQNQVPGVVMLNRLCPWKPRSDPTSWHGEETTNPQGALSSLANISKIIPVAFEIGLFRHIDTYARLASLTWIGARALEGIKLAGEILAKDVTLTVGIKNDVNGYFSHAATNNSNQRLVRWGQNTFPIFRGGIDLNTPDDWERALVDLSIRFNGRIIVDAAHGGEMAHDPKGRFEKSAIGQQLCLDHILELMISGVVVKGIMLEASDTISPTDPLIPHQTGLTYAEEAMQILLNRREY